MITLDTDLPYGMAVVAYRLPGFESPDFAAGQVLADVLDSRRGNLYGLVPDGKALFAGFNGVALPRAAMGYAEAGFPHGGDGAALIARMKQNIADYREHGIPADLVEAARRHEIADAEFEKNSVAGLAATWSQALAVEGRNSPDEDIEAVKRVTVEDVNRVARDYLLNDTAIVAILTPRPSGNPVTSAGVRRQESFAPKETRPVRLPGWAKKAMALPSAPRAYADPFVTILPNGLRLIIQPETVSRTVSVFGRVKNNPDLQMPRGQEGVAEILDGLFSYGTTRLGPSRIPDGPRRYRRDRLGGDQFFTPSPGRAVRARGPVAGGECALPALPDAAFKIVQSERQSAVAGLLQSPTHVSRHALREILYPKGDPRLRQATPQTVESLTLEDVKAYYAKVFRPDMTTIIVIGRIGPDQAKADIERYFGAWRAAGEKPNTDLPPVPMNPTASTVVPDTSRVQDEVTLAQTLGVTRFHPDIIRYRWETVSSPARRSPADCFAICASRAAWCTVWTPCSTSARPGPSSAYSTPAIRQTSRRRATWWSVIFTSYRAGA